MGSKYGTCVGCDEPESPLLYSEEAEAELCPACYPSEEKTLTLQDAREATERGEALPCRWCGEAGGASV